MLQPHYKRLLPQPPWCSDKGSAFKTTDSVPAALNNTD
jgi:hypothetical protein